MVEFTLDAKPHDLLALREAKETTQKYLVDISTKFDEDAYVIASCETS